MIDENPLSPDPAREPGPHIGLILALTIRGLAVGSYPDIARTAQTAESCGFDSVWLCDPS